MNATSAPAVNRPASTSRPPNQKMPMRLARKSVPTTVQKPFVSSAERRATSKTFSLAAPYRALSCGSRPNACTERMPEIASSACAVAPASASCTPRESFRTRDPTHRESSATNGTTANTATLRRALSVTMSATDPISDRLCVTSSTSDDVTADRTAPTSLVRRLVMSPVRVREKKARSRRTRWS